MRYARGLGFQACDSKWARDGPRVSSGPDIVARIKITSNARWEVNCNKRASIYRYILPCTANDNYRARRLFKSKYSSVGGRGSDASLGVQCRTSRTPVDRIDEISAKFSCLVIDDHSIPGSEKKSPRC